MQLLVLSLQVLSTDNPRLSTSVLFAPLFLALSKHCPVPTIAGGYNGGADYLSSTYQLSGKTWTRLPDMKEARDAHSCHLFQGEVVVMGGWDGDDGLTSVEILSLATKEWRRGPALPSRVDDGHSAVYGDTLYLLDSDGNGGDGSVLGLSPGTGAEWRVVENIGKMSEYTRQVFPAPVVSSDMLGC